MWAGPSPLTPPARATPTARSSRSSSSSSTPTATSLTPASRPGSPWTWEKVFTKAGTYTINTTVYDNDGAQSPASDPCRLTFEVTQKKLFWTVGGGPRGSYWRQHGPLRVPARRAVRLDHARQVELHPERRRRPSRSRAPLEVRLHWPKPSSTATSRASSSAPGLAVSSATQATDANHNSASTSSPRPASRSSTSGRARGRSSSSSARPLGRSFNSNYKAGAGFRFLF